MHLIEVDEAKAERRNRICNKSEVGLKLVLKSRISFPLLRLHIIILFTRKKPGIAAGYSEKNPFIFY